LSEPGTRILRVAVLSPLRSFFDYLPAESEPSAPIAAGCRVRVPLGRSERIGVVVRDCAPGDDAVRGDLKPVRAVLDAEPVIDASLMALALWAIHYYHCPPGEVFEALLPAELRRGEPPRQTREPAWQLTPAGAAALQGGERLGPRQRELLESARTGAITRAVLADLNANMRVLRDLERRGWLIPAAEDSAPQPAVVDAARFLPLNPGQSEACARISDGLDAFGVHLLHGVTGSGKTEIYLHLAREVIARGGQVLVLVPEIGLTEQIVRRFADRFGAMVGLVHSELSERARALEWQRCRTGEIRILLGTRSAVWMPLPRLALVVVDEEHDASFKQQEGFRYSARDVAVMRARRLNIPVVLGSATPSLESLANCDRGKYAYLPLGERAGGASLPSIRVLDIRGMRLSSGISDPLRRAILERAERGEQTLLFLNRRGFAPVVLCHACGWIAGCPRCDSRLVLHQEQERLRCHHCGFERRTDAVLPGHPCGRLETYAGVGIGTEQLEGALEGIFPGLRILRIDRDAMRHKGDLERAFARIRQREVDLLIGTQMIAKGHDFAHVTLVGIVDGDSGLLARDFRAEERFMQTVLQVAGRAGRGEQAGEVLIQSHHPEHPVFGFLRTADYRGFAVRALAERTEAEMPPHTALAMLRAEAPARETPQDFLRELADWLRKELPQAVFIGGPVPALMERKVGRYRANLLLSCADRGLLSAALETALAKIRTLPLARRVRWHLDVDAQETG
jgi:primosomal protein N' (replication factor Y)